jgi:chromosome partitioning protein
VLLASELAKQGEAKNLRLGLVDVDPNQHSAAWADLPGCPDNIVIYKNVSEDSIFDTIEQAKRENAFVLVDLEGVSSNAVTFAISQADLVVVPCQASQNDAKEAIKTIRMIKNSARMINRTIPHAILFTRINAAITTKTNRFLREQFVNAGITVLATALIERESYRSVFSFGGSIYDTEVSTIKEQETRNKSILNVKAIATDVKKILANHLRQKKQQQQEVDHA